MLLSIKEDSKSLREDNVALKQRMDKLETGDVTHGHADMTEHVATTSATTSATEPPPRKRRQCDTTASEDIDWQPIASDEVRGTVKQRLTTMAAPSAQLLEPQFNMEEDMQQQPEQQQSWMPQHNVRKQLPATGNTLSGRHRTVDSTATHTVLWPQERVHDARGLRMKYEDLSWDKFVLGLLCVISEAELTLQPLLYMHLRELMEDAGMYGLEPVKAFHGVWLNHIEQGRATWHDEKTREKLRRQFVWNAPRHAPAATAQHVNKPVNFPNHAAPSSDRGQGRRRQYAPVVPAGPDNKPCKAFNLGTCSKGTSHPQADHVCSFCFRAQNRLCYHMEKDCGNKLRAAAKN
jgi:hypothetical protein